MVSRKKIIKMVEELGYESIEQYLDQKINVEKFTIANIAVLINDYLKTSYGYSTIYLALKKHIPKNFHNRLRHEHRREKLAKENGYDSFEDLLKALKKRNLNYREIATILKCGSPSNVFLLEEEFGFKLVDIPEINKLGFRSMRIYREWNEKAKSLGFPSFEFAIKALSTEFSVKEMARMFNVSDQGMWSRLNKFKEAQQGKTDSKDQVLEDVNFHKPFNFENSIK
jgi:hypothetical protein